MSGTATAKGKSLSSFLAESFPGFAVGDPEITAAETPAGSLLETIFASSLIGTSAHKTRHPDATRGHYLPGASYSSDIPIDARTSAIVLAEALRACSDPASRISQASLGFSSNFLRRSWIGFSNCTSASAAQLLHSMQPIPADRQPSYTFARVSLLLKILCRSPTGQTSGWPGSERR